MPYRPIEWIDFNFIVIKSDENESIKSLGGRRDSKV